MRGKTSDTVGPRHSGPVAASMRPPQNAGENLRQARRDPVWGAASMRPPQNAGENNDAIIECESHFTLLQ